MANTEAVACSVEQSLHFFVSKEWALVHPHDAQGAYWILDNVGEEFLAVPDNRFPTSFVREIVERAEEDGLAVLITFDTDHWPTVPASLEELEPANV